MDNFFNEPIPQSNQLESAIQQEPFEGIDSELITLEQDIQTKLDSNSNEISLTELDSTLFNLQNTNPSRLIDFHIFGHKLSIDTQPFFTIAQSISFLIIIAAFFTSYKIIVGAL